MAKCTAVNERHRTLAAALRCPLHRPAGVDPAKVKQGVGRLPQHTMDSIGPGSEALSASSLDPKPERVRIASSPTTPVSSLIRLADDRHGTVQGAVARNPHTPPDVLDRLSQRDDRLAAYVAANPSARPSTLDRLSRSDEARVLTAVARNASTSPETLLRMATDEQADLYCVGKAASNAMMRVEDIVRLARSRKHRRLRSFLAANPSMPPEILDEFAASDDSLVRLKAVKNYAMPPRAVGTLTRDEDPSVRDAAIEVAVDAFEEWFGVSRDNTGARDLLLDTDWWNQTRDSEAVRLILTMHPEA